MIAASADAFFFSSYQIGSHVLLAGGVLFLLVWNALLCSSSLFDCSSSV